MKPLVLLINGDPSLREVLEEFLLQSGYCVFLASNSSEGIKIAGRIRVDLVIMDLDKPGYDGNFFTEWLSTSPEPVPVINVFGNIKEVESPYINDDTLRRPFSLDHLGELIYKALDKHHFQHFSSNSLAPYYYFE